MSRNIGESISKAIKESKWLYINYKNTRNTFTNFWIAIYDIDFENKRLDVKIFNDRIALNTISNKIYFDKIKSAIVLDFTSYQRPEELITKIERNKDKAKWLCYDHFSYNLLNYYIECNYLDNDPVQKEYSTIPGIDLDLLQRNSIYYLNEIQAKHIIENIYHCNINEAYKINYTLVINRLSIDEGEKKYVVCYHVLSFDPSQLTLIVNNDFRFNSSFMVQGRKKSIFNYINMDVNEFMNTYEYNEDEYKNIILGNLRYSEFLNTKPDIMILEREYTVDLNETYSIIEERYRNNSLAVPLKSFFGNNLINYNDNNNNNNNNNQAKEVEPSIIFYDKFININQMQVIYNTLKKPVTFVQGPPGTGKTQTIFNVILNAFYNDKTVLICSNNNKPVDGIIKKIKLFYHNEEIHFPFLRLGNVRDVQKATKKILEYSKMAFDTISDYDIEDDKELEKLDEDLKTLKEYDKEYQRELLEQLKIHEEVKELVDFINESNRFVQSFEKNTNNSIITMIRKKTEKKQQELNEKLTKKRDDLHSLFTPFIENELASRYFYYKSMKYINKLKKSSYNELIRICSIKKPEVNSWRFNEWCQNNDNIRQLTKVFPIIFTTNISSLRLGTPDFMFDLVVMDEASQCNIAKSLIPITKAKSLLMVGDPNQLRPVITLEESVNKILMEKYHVPATHNYKKYSILDVMTNMDKISKYLLLKYHYRSGYNIINFSNQRYYRESLDISSVQNRRGDVELLDVKNQNVMNRNEAYDEAVAVVNYIERNHIHNASIITPFVNQKNLINDILKNKNITDIHCGTIHSLQGAEQDTVIMSMAISQRTSQRTFQWIKDNFEIINVAVTRAKSKLVIAADTESINALSTDNDDLANLIRYVRSNGRETVPPNESVRVEIGRSNGSLSENEFFKTVSHLCTCYPNFVAKRNINIKELFPSYDRNGPNYEYDLVVYSISTMEETTTSTADINMITNALSTSENFSDVNSYLKPVCVFEINGGEHFGDMAREQADEAKREICRQNKVKIITIDNTIVKDYEFIRELLMNNRNNNN